MGRPTKNKMWDESLGTEIEYYESPEVDALFESLEARVKELESQLAEMTEDRNLWQGEHNEDCPNLAQIEELKQLALDVRNAAKGDPK